MRSMWKMMVVAGLMATQSMAGGLALFGSYWDAKDADDTFGGGAKFRANLNENVQLDVGGSYFMFEDDEMGVDSELEVIPVEAALSFRTNIADTFAVYVGGGAGYYFVDGEMSDGGTTLDVDIDDEIGFFAQAGIEIGLGANLSLIGEVQYVWLEFDKAELSSSDAPGEKLDIDVDLKMDGLRANAGLLFRF